MKAQKNPHRRYRENISNIIPRRSSESQKDEELKKGLANLNNLANKSTNEMAEKSIVKMFNTFKKDSSKALYFIVSVGANFSTKMKNYIKVIGVVISRKLEESFPKNKFNKKLIK